MLQIVLHLAATALQRTEIGSRAAEVDSGLQPTESRENNSHGSAAEAIGRRQQEVTLTVWQTVNMLHYIVERG